MASKFFAVVAGVGAGTGRSVALKFAQTYPVVLLARKPESYNSIVEEIKAAGGRAIGISTDTADRKSVDAAFATIKKELPDQKLAAAVFNASTGLSRKGFLDQTPEDFELSLRGNALGLFNFAQATIPLLLASTSDSPHPPTLIVTGATASVRGSAKFGDFAAGKFAVRALSQSLAREFGPQGVHVAHTIVDGIIDIPRTKAYNVNGGGPDSKIDPGAIADSYWYLHTQPRSHFTLELDTRPYNEKF
ncbi:NAD(P)-binding protein [Coniochaeta ligniaria NRRL 30616]|uniref:NAD(P)-binding protein n=1 Tax=Coniochaeta ligniaria NRRL 30616 TaxID=1408157 RepID=A0A1J7IIR5_9PEZI|nr:NAD(P)-binding protein [Coniochaeta ligniaria NRRL 30616]